MEPTVSEPNELPPFLETPSTRRASGRTARLLWGFEVTLLLAGAILVASGVVGVLGLQRLKSAEARQRGRTERASAGEGQ
jgi:hypothetical protein